jgi:hypothetical protein
MWRMMHEANSLDLVDIFRPLLPLSFSPYRWQICQHLGEAAFDGFHRDFPALRAIHLAKDHTDDIDKGLQGPTSLAGFLVMIIGCCKEVVDMVNDLIT